ncbi:MAG: Flp family type IVb pilin [Pseudomonadota bacterium]
MGETGQPFRLSDAAGGPAAGRLAARLSLKAFGRDRSGATAVEYGLICALVFLVIVASVTTFGTRTTTIIQTVSDAIAAAIA